MKNPDELWTSQDLELFHDDQLDADRASRLSAALQRDPSLQAQLDEVDRVDDALRHALLQVPVARSSTPRAGRQRWLVAASVLFAVGVGGWWASGIVRQGRHASRLLVEAPVHSAVRIVFSLPLSRARVSADENVPIDRSSSREEEERRFLTRLGRTLVSGDVDATLDVLASVPVDRRRVGYRYLGDVLRSAQAAELILNGLGPEEQLAVCGHWAGDSAIRSAVFSRLERLSDDPSMTDQVHEVLAELSTDPALRPWIRGYQLWQGS